ncbi:PAS domain-containing protein [Synechococcus sp. BA-132 BA5]|uniref:PAS domain-containing protein n=1 Tax=Synechococcus sp. BA-132 BA5 TaxID=3110252 RepID=UPI002B202DC8|nr:PAS domain S-box protein [Synechococcus sp. BA-132 BA5]
MATCLRNSGQCLFIVQIAARSEAQRHRVPLAEQEKRYSQLAENADDVVCRLDPEGRMIWLSPSVKPCLGWHPEQLLNQGLEAIIDPVDQPKLLELLDRNHASVLLNLRVRCANGAWRWMGVKARQVSNSAGDWIGWVSSWRDIQAEVEMHQAERQRQEARTSLAENALAITEAIPVGTYTMVQPPTGGMASFGFMSERFLQITGLKREEAAANPFKVFACVHPDDYDAWVHRNAEAFANQQSFVGECRVVVGGDVRWIRAESVPRALTDGSTIWEGVLMDISDQHRVLEQLEQERSLLNAVLTHIDAHVYMKNRQGRYLYANANAEQQLIHDLESVVGHTDAELMASGAALAIQDLDEQVFSTGGPLWREERLPLPNGAERIFLTKKLLYRQPGQEDCLIGFSTDITELRRTTKQLAASEEHFRLLAENSSDVVFRVDSAGRIVWVSPSLTTALGWLPTDWIGQVGTQFLLHQGEAEHYHINLETLKMSGHSVIAREQIYAKDGSIHWIQTHAGPYVNSKGVVEGIVASFRLIDEIVQAEETLRLSEQRHRRLADQMLDVVWAINLEGQFTYFSRSLQRVRGFTPKELMAIPLEQQFTADSYAIVLDGWRPLHWCNSPGTPTPA